MGVNARMLIKTKNQYQLTEEEVLFLAYRLYNCFDDNLMVQGEKGIHCLEIIDKYEQDGRTIYPKPDEQFIEVNIFGSYYGIGYERGSLYIYIMMAEWLEKNIGNCKIFYGGDSDGVCIRSFGKRIRNKLFNYYCKKGHFEYQSYHGKYINKNNPICPLCKQPTTQYSVGNTFSLHRCDGCNYSKRVQRNEVKEGFRIEI